jgi:hypothetical protein
VHTRLNICYSKHHVLFHSLHHHLSCAHHVDAPLQIDDAAILETGGVRLCRSYHTHHTDSISPIGS